jgi:hypothetical protein
MSVNSSQPRIEEGAGAVENDKARIATRLSSDYFIRSLRLLSEWAGGDVMTSLISLAIIQGNIGHLDRSGGPGGDFADPSTPPPDELRRPVSVLSISEALGLPYETTRRHVQKMLKAGQCVRVKRGVVLSVSALSGPAHAAFLRSNLSNVRRLYRALRTAGVEVN